MAKRRLSKEDVKGPDAFQESAGAVTKFIEDNKVPFFAVVVFLMLAGGSYALYGFYKEKMEYAAQEDLYIASVKHERLLQSESEGDETEAPVNKNPDVKKDFSEVISLYEKVINEHNGTTAALIAATKLADIHNFEGHSDKALNVFENVSTDIKPEGLVSGLALLSLGHHLEASGKCDMAVQEWDKIVSSPKMRFLHAEAHLKIGLCHESLNNRDQALRHYKVLSDDFGDTSAGRTGKRLMTMLRSQGEA